MRQSWAPCYTELPIKLSWIHDRCSLVSWLNTSSTEFLELLPTPCCRITRNKGAIIVLRKFPYVLYRKYLWISESPGTKREVITHWQGVRSMHRAVGALCVYGSVCRGVPSTPSPDKQYDLWHLNRRIASYLHRGPGPGAIERCFITKKINPQSLYPGWLHGRWILDTHISNVRLKVEISQLESFNSKCLKSQLESFNSKC